jgi:phosphatidylserine decarboxylase
VVSGEILLQFSLYDPSRLTAPPQETYRKFRSIVCAGEEEEEVDLSQAALHDQGDVDKEDETSDETDDPTRPEVVEKRKRRLRLARLKRKARAYQFSGSGNAVEGIVFMEISRITDLPPERNGRRPYDAPLAFDN